VDEWNAVYAMGFDRVGALKGEKRSSGIVQGEGGFAVLLETEENARQRGGRPLARLTGLSMAGVPSEPYRFNPDRGAIERCVRAALDDAGVSPDEIDLLFPSRNGVTEMDRVEEETLRAVFGSLPRTISVKDAIGEMAAAGGGQIVAACRAVAGPDIPGALVLPRRALVDSFGAGGNFLAAVIEAPA
jgi:3-oxoacyl-(acyl-carrier-protein) synthase